MADENPETTEAPAEPQDEAPAESEAAAPAETEAAEPAETEAAAPAETEAVAPEETQEEASAEPQTEAPAGEVPVESQEEAQKPEPQAEGGDVIAVTSVTNVESKSSEGLRKSSLKVPKTEDDKGSKVAIKESITSLKPSGSLRPSKTRQASVTIASGVGEGESSTRVPSTGQLARDSMLVTQDAAEAQVQLMKSSQALAMPRHAKTDKKSRIGLGKASSTSVTRHGAADAERAKALKFMNTYRLESKNPFKPDVIKRLLIEIIDKGFEDVKYNPLECARLCLTITNELRAKVKQQGYDRYKYVCTLEIGEKNCQSVQSILGFLWDAERDNYATYTFENSHLYAIASVYGIYYE